MFPYGQAKGKGFFGGRKFPPLFHNWSIHDYTHGQYQSNSISYRLKNWGLNAMLQFTCHLRGRVVFENGHLGEGSSCVIYSPLFQRNSPLPPSSIKYSIKFISQPLTPLQFQHILLHISKNQNWKVVSRVKLVGVVVNHDLKWQMNTNYICSKGSQKILI